MKIMGIKNWGFMTKSFLVNDSFFSAGRAQGLRLNLCFLKVIAILSHETEAHETPQAPQYQGGFRTAQLPMSPMDFWAEACCEPLKVKARRFG